MSNKLSTILAAVITVTQMSIYPILPSCSNSSESRCVSYNQDTHSSEYPVIIRPSYRTDAQPFQQALFTDEEEKIMEKCLISLYQILTPGPLVKMKFMDKSPDGLYVLIVQNDWIVFSHRFRLEKLQDLAENPIHASLTDFPERFIALVKEQYISESFLEEILTSRFNLRINEVIKHPKPPYYLTSPALFWNKYNKTFSLILHGVSDLERNACWTAAIDIKTGAVISVNETPCFIR